MATDPSSTKAGAVGVRGISYPAISLESAVKRATMLWEHERKNAAPLEAVASHWGYSPTSSGVRTTAAALLSYGLVSDQGSGEGRKIQLTSRGLDIVLETQERDRALRDAVLSPKIFAELLAQWPADNLPSDQTIKVYLLRHKNFNPKAVDGFVKDFKESIGFSGLAKAGSMLAVSSSESSESPQMRQQTGEQNYGDRSIEHVLRAVSPQAISAGERELFSFELSADTKCRVLVTGEIGSEEIDSIIELLEMRKRTDAKKRTAEIKLIGQTKED